MEAGLACPDWPLCFGSFLPGRQMNVQVFLEWFHRLDAFVIGIALVVMAVATTLQRHQLPRWLPWLAAGLMVLVAMQGALGALTVTRLLPSGVVTAHLALALTLVALLSGLTQRLLHPAAVVAPLWWRIGASLGLLSVFVQCLLGGRMATAWAGQRCLAGGEACQLVLSHRVTAMPVAVVVLAFAGAAVLAGGWARQQWPWLAGAVLLVLVQVALGVLTLRLGLSQPAVTVAHQLVAALLIALLAALLVRSPDLPSSSRSVVLDDTSLEACHG
jgi:cytochrome c oxidase assembly protein subunit 15